MIPLPLLQKTLQLRNPGGTPQVFDPVRRLWLVLTPEEHVRQLLLLYLLDDLAYPQGLMAVEKKLGAGALSRRFDLVVYHRQTHQPWLLAECKAPEVPITEAALYQLLAYQRHLGAQYWVLCNGLHTLCANAADPASPQWMDALPAYDL